MAFDPDAYLAKKEGGFDPDAYLAKKDGAAPVAAPAPNVPPAAPVRTMPQQLARDAGLTARMPLKAIMSPIQVVSDAGADLANKLKSGFMRISGADKIPGVGKPSVTKSPFNMEAALSTLGLPKPETRGEKFREGVGEFALPLAGPAVKLAEKGPALMKAIREAPALLRGDKIKEAADALRTRVGGIASDSAASASRRVAGREGDLIAAEAKEKGLRSGTRTPESIGTEARGLAESQTQKLEEARSAAAKPLREEALASAKQKEAAHASSQPKTEPELTPAQKIGLAPRPPRAPVTQAPSLGLRMQDHPSADGVRAAIEKAKNEFAPTDKAERAAYDDLLKHLESGNFEQWDTYRRQMANAGGFGAPLEGYKAIDKIAAKNISQAIGKAMGEYEPKFGEYLNKYKEHSRALDPSRATSGAAILKEKIPDYYVAGAETIPAKAFGSKEKFDQFAALIGNKDKAESLALDHFRDKIKDMKPDAILDYLKKNREVLDAVPAVENKLIREVHQPLARLEETAAKLSADKSAAEKVADFEKNFMVTMRQAQNPQEIVGGLRPYLKKIEQEGRAKPADVDKALAEVAQLEKHIKTREEALKLARHALLYAGVGAAGYEGGKMLIGGR